MLFLYICRLNSFCFQISMIKYDNGMCFWSWNTDSIIAYFIVLEFWTVSHLSFFKYNRKKWHSREVKVGIPNCKDKVLICVEVISIRWYIHEIFLNLELTTVFLFSVTTNRVSEAKQHIKPFLLVIRDQVAYQNYLWCIFHSWRLLE